MKQPKLNGSSLPAGASETPQLPNFSLTPLTEPCPPIGSPQWEDKVELDALDRMFERRKSKPQGPMAVTTQEMYATAREKYLQDAHPKTYAAWKKSGYLKEHLAEVGQDAMEMAETLHSQMMTSKNLPTDYLQRVAHLEAIPLKVREIVQHEVIFAPV